MYSTVCIDILYLQCKVCPFHRIYTDWQWPNIVYGNIIHNNYQRRAILKSHHHFQQVHALFPSLPSASASASASPVRVAPDSVAPRGLYSEPLESSQPPQSELLPAVGSQMSSPVLSELPPRFDATGVQCGNVAARCTWCSLVSGARAWNTCGLCGLVGCSGRRLLCCK